MPTTTTPQMNLVMPVVSSELGPLWATELNTLFGVIDSHDHSSGKGVKVTPSGMNISSDLAFNTNNATHLRSTQFDTNGSALVGASDVRCIYTIGTDLWYNNSAGTPIQITGGAAGIQLGGDLLGDASSVAAPRVGRVTGTSGILGVACTNVQFLASVTSPKLWQAPPLSDVGTNNFTISPQAPYSAAAINQAPGSVIVSVPAPIGGGANGNLQVKIGATTMSTIGNVGGIGSISLGPTPQAAGSIRLTNISSAGAGPLIGVRNVANSLDLTLVTTDALDSCYFGNTSSGITKLQAATELRLELVGGTQISIVSGFMNFAAALTGPTVTQELSPSKATGAPLTIAGQACNAGGSTGGGLILSPGTGAAANGKIRLNNINSGSSAMTTGAVTVGNAVGWFEIMIGATVAKVPYYT